MTTRRRALPALLVLAALIAAQAALAAPSKLQTTFKDALLADAKTTSAVKKGLESGTVFVDPTPTFADLTGDAKSDAIVSVVTGGAAGAVAVYVFSTDGASDGKLRAVYRNQQLFRGVAKAQGSTFVVRVPQYAAGDALCCPAKVLEKTYTWTAKSKSFRLTGSRTVAGPKAPAAATPAPAPTTPTTTTTTPAATTPATTTPTTTTG